MDHSEKVSIAWHPAFCSAAEFDLREAKDQLIFEPEHNLSREPLRIDLLIIRKTTDEPIDNDIARIFRRYNVIEYKSPGDGLTIDDWYKTIGYACLYKGTAKTVDEVPEDELTVSLFREAYPAELMERLKETGAEIREAAPGVYHILNKGPFPAQIVVTGQLESRHAGLKILSRAAGKEDVSAFLMMAVEAVSPGDRRNVDAILEVSVSANGALYEEIRRNNAMCEALRNLMKDEILQAETDARNRGLNEGRVEGRMEGRMEGQKQGEDRQARQTALNLHAIGMDVSFIAKATGYPEQTVSGWVLKN